jgi:uncharacterized protein (TIRG00374 family)
MTATPPASDLPNRSAPETPSEASAAPAPKRGGFLSGPLGIVLRLAAVAGLVWWLASRVDLAKFAATLRAADPVPLVLALVVLAVAQVTAAWRWYRLLKAAGGRWDFRRTGIVYAASLFLGLFIPTGVGGDVYRIARVRRSGTGLGRGTATILLERAVGLLALLLLGSGFVLSAPGTRPWGALFVLASIAGILGLAALWIPGGEEVAARLFDRVKKGLGDRLRNAFPLEAMDRLRGAMLGTVLLSILNHAWLLLANVLIARGLGLPVSAAAVCAAVPLVLLAAQAPITPGGVGVREAGFVYFLGRVGVPESEAFALALTFFALLLVIGLAAGVGLLMDRDSTSAAQDRA